MKKVNINKLSREELKVLSLERGKNGCYTSSALAAQRKLFLAEYGVWGAYGFDANGYANGLPREFGRRLTPNDFDESYD